MGGLKRGSGPTPETLINTIWGSSFMAMIFALPPLGIFLGIYLGTGQLVVGAVVGFGVHFVTLAFSDRISKVVAKAIK